MARTKNATIVIRYGDKNIVVYDYGLAKSPRFELWDESAHKSLAKSNNPIDFDPLVFGEEWAERNNWYEIHEQVPPKKRRTGKTS